ncbi:MAG: hypothetical protein SNJ77_00420 [Cytophagales bacterium]
MEIVLDFIKILVPASLALYGVYSIVRMFLNKEFEKRIVELKMKNTELILPIRLQAYERICLLLERISPHNLLLRLNDSTMTSYQLQQKLIFNIREELNHNLSQQVYMSDQSWQMVKATTEEVIGLINSAAETVPQDARSIELAKTIFDKLLQKNEDPCSRALKYIKNEIQQVF